jgi:putative transposase
MGKVHLLPGTPFSNIQEKGDLNPDKTAAMTIDEVERWLDHPSPAEERRLLARLRRRKWNRSGP